MPPATLLRMHPNDLESFRMTGLTITERRAIFAVLHDVSKAWNEGDEMMARKLAWFKAFSTTFKSALRAYEAGEVAISREEKV